MYTPDWANVKDQELIISILRKYDFSTIVAVRNNNVEISHLPLMATLEKGDSSNNLKLFGHVASKNPLASYFDGLSKIIAIFRGPHHYISPSWYKAEGVPTWNYIAIHCEGFGSIISYKEAELHFDSMTDMYEKEFGSGWNKSILSERGLDKRLQNISHFSIDVQEVNGKFKMSQNRGCEDKNAVIDALYGLGGDNSKQVANFIKNLMGKR